MIHCFNDSQFKRFSKVSGGWKHFCLNRYRAPTERKLSNNNKIWWKILFKHAIWTVIQYRGGVSFIIVACLILWHCAHVRNFHTLRLTSPYLDWKVKRSEKEREEIKSVVCIDQMLSFEVIKYGEATIPVLRNKTLDILKLTLILLYWMAITMYRILQWNLHANCIPPFNMKLFQSRNYIGFKFY